MAIRDVLIFAAVFGSLPFILWRPWFGVLVWSWLAYMNPHRLGWGPAFDFRFSVIVALVLVVAILISRERKRMLWTPVTYVWLAFFIWTFITTQFAYDEIGAADEWSRWWKVNLASVLTLLVMYERRRIHLLVSVIAGSLAFYGVKGGFFTVISGGGYRVYGPPGSFIEDNNAMGLALILVVPLLRYLQLEAKDRWVRWSLAGGMVLTVIAILGTQSRGALVGLVAMGLFLVWKSQGRWKMLFAALLLMPVLWVFMPSSWHARMSTISSYEQDSSALGRINAWWFAFNIAKERPLIGGGFATFTEELFQRYAPNPEDVHDAHSIYFEVLGEQGFVGLVLFLLLGLFTFQSAQWVIKNARGPPELRWAGNLVAMVQVSLIGYAVSGAFLGLAYFDLVYHLIVIVVLTRSCVEQALRAPAPTPTPMPAPTPATHAVGRRSVARAGRLGSRGTTS